MRDRSVFVRIREGAFSYLLVADQPVSVERRDSAAFQTADDKPSLRTAWYLSGGDRIPVIRLGLLLRTEVGDWGYAVLLSDGLDRVALAAEQIHPLGAADKPMIQPFNPAGCGLAGGSVITGVCPSTEPECLVLDATRLQRCLARSRQR